MSISLANVVGKQSTLILDRINSNRTIELDVPYSSWQLLIILIPTQEVNITIRDELYQLQRGIYYIALQSIAGNITERVYEIISVSGDNLEEMDRSQQVNLCIQRCLRCYIVANNPDPVLNFLGGTVAVVGIAVTAGICGERCEAIPISSERC